MSDKSRLPWDTSSRARILVKSKPCRFYANGHCKEGPQCDFLHQRDVRGEARFSRSQSANRPDTRWVSLLDRPQSLVRCNYFANTGKCRNGFDCAFLHDYGDVSGRKLTYDPEGDRCRSPDVRTRRHDVPSLMSLRISERNRSPSVIRQKSFCHYFNAGNCTKGDECQFPHVPSKAFSQTVVPGSPVNVKMTEVTAESITVVWDSPESDVRFPIKGYIIETNCPDVDDVFREAVIVRGSETCKACVKGLDEDTKYKIRVFAYNSAGLSTKSATSEGVKTSKKLPPSVTHLRVTKVTADSATLVWDKPKQQAGDLPIDTYFVEKKVGDNGKFELATTVDGSKLTARLACSQVGQYVFRVFAISGKRHSKRAAYSNVLVTQSCLPSPPQNVRIDEVAIHWATICWDSSDSTVTGYIVEKRVVDSQEFAFCVEVKASCSVTLRDLQQDLSYDVRVFAKNQYGRSVTAGLLKPPLKLLTVPGPPVNVDATEVTTESIKLAWEAPAIDIFSPVMGYIIEKNCPDVDDVFREAVTISGSNNCKVCIGGLAEGTKYKFRVFSYNKAGFSAESAELGKDVKTAKSKAADTGMIECKVCMDRNITHAFLPCKHMVCCERCAQTLKYCPICRNVITETCRIYL